MAKFSRKSRALLNARYTKIINFDNFILNSIRECSSNCVILKIISQISVYLENKYPAEKLPKPNLISAYSI
jgi:hypothetical protein